MGSGTYVIAAVEQGFDAVGVEKDPDNYREARDRIWSHFDY